MNKTPFINRFETFALGIVAVSGIFALDIVNPWWPLSIAGIAAISSFVWRHAGSPTPTIKL